MVKLLTAEYGVENIVKSFGGAKALSGVSLSVKGGEVHCIAGENGSGKSTLTGPPCSSRSSPWFGCR